MIEAAPKWINRAIDDALADGKYHSISCGTGECGWFLVIDKQRIKPPHNNSPALSHFTMEVGALRMIGVAYTARPPK